MISVKSLLKQSALLSRINAHIKAATQENTAHHLARRYRKEATQRGIVVLEGKALQHAVSERLSGRVASRGWPRKAGELHLFLAFPLHNWETVLPHAFETFCEVTVFEWRSRGFDDSTPDWLSRRDAMNEAMLAAFHEANWRCPVDAVVGYLSGYAVAPATLAAMADAGAAVFNFSFDDRLHFPGSIVGGRYQSTAALASVVDLNLTSDSDSLVKYAVHGGLAMFHPEAADPRIHRPYDALFEYDVSFIGAKYGNRGPFIDRLADKGIRVECFGAGWPNGEVALEEMVRIYSRSRINLGFAGIGYSDRLMCLKGRDFEVPMSGGLYLTQHNPELELVYEIGKEIVTYRDVKDCAGKIRELLGQPQRAEAIRQAGRARCLRDHTYEARWTKVFTLAGILED